MNFISYLKADAFATEKFISYIFKNIENFTDESVTKAEADAAKAKEAADAAQAKADAAKAEIAKAEADKAQAKADAIKAEAEIKKRKSADLIGIVIIIAILFNLIIFIYALHLAWKCSHGKGIGILEFLGACCFSPFYVLYRLISPCNDNNVRNTRNTYNSNSRITNNV
jgi:hypothetical protein